MKKYTSKTNLNLPLDDAFYFCIKALSEKENALFVNRKSIKIEEKSKVEIATFMAWGTVGNTISLSFIEISTNQTQVEITSKSNDPRQIIDFGANRRIVKKVLELLQPNKNSINSSLPPNKTQTAFRKFISQHAESLISGASILIYITIGLLAAYDFYQDGLVWFLCFILPYILLPLFGDFFLHIPTQKLYYYAIDRGEMPGIPHDIQIFLDKAKLLANEQELLEKARLLEEALNKALDSQNSKVSSEIFGGNFIFDRFMPQIFGKIPENRFWCAHLQHELASALLQSKEIDNVERAIFLCQKNLDVYDQTKFPLACAKTNMLLGGAYGYSLGKRTENIELSIKHTKLAISIFSQYNFSSQDLEPTGVLKHLSKLRGFHWIIGLVTSFKSENAYIKDQLANAHILLGVWYSLLDKISNTENIEQAILESKKSLEIYTKTSSPIDWALTQGILGSLYEDRIIGSYAENIEQAIYYLEQSLVVHTCNIFPEMHEHTQSALGRLHFDLEHWQESAIAYQGAINANKLLFGRTTTREWQLKKIVKSKNIFAYAAYALIQLRQYGDALVQMEKGKTRLLVQAVEKEEALLGLLSEEEQVEFLQVRENFRTLQLERELPEASSQRRPIYELAPLQEVALTQLNETIKQLRMAHPDFMPEGLDLDGLLALTPVDGALIAPIVTSHGGGVWIVPHGITEVTNNYYLPLEKLTEKRVEQWIIGTEENRGWIPIYLNFRKNPHHSINDLAGWEDILNEVNQYLLVPVRKKLAALHILHRAELLLMPQGRLGLFPLHQFWLDAYTVRYAPSGYAMQASERRLAEGQRSGGAEGRLLAVVNPTGDLQFTPYEGEAVANLFGGEKTLYHEGAATRTPILEALGQHDYLHFSCHGNFGWGDSDQTGLSLAHGERLTLRDILTHRLRPARLVTLSACETGMTDVTKAADEFLGLPAAFLQAGAIGVVGTLWAVNDLSTTLLMERFYTLHLGGMAPAQALRQAQIWLRDVSAGELAKQLSAQRRTLYQAGQSDSSHFDYVTAMADHFGEMEAAEHPYTHPYYWAAFTFSGA